MNLKHLCLSIALLALSFSVTAEQMMYVQSAKANVMTGPDFDTVLAGVLQKGDAVTVVNEQGRWSQVNHQNATGWMFTLLLANQPPMDKISVLQGKEAQLEKSSRRRASTEVTAAATRGLRNDESTRKNETGAPDYHELQTMEAVEIKETEVRKFHEEGMAQ